MTEAESNFSCRDSESTFLSFVAGEFYKRGTARRLELSKKELSHPLVERQGLLVPSRYDSLNSLQHIKLEDYPSRFVLKFARGWSARGVMTLERVSRDQYFDHIGLRLRNSAEIVEAQNKVAESFGGEPAWLVEEFVESYLPGRPIPFDYKLYTFNGVVGLIGQFDRNASPPRVQLFDGGFRPLRLGRDYIISSQNLQPGLPVIPLNAPELLWWAQRLSTQADSPFVSVDMYDTAAGPVFGEFTYSPGGIHKRMFRLSREQLARLDALLDGNHPVCQLSAVGLSQRQRLSRPPVSQFGPLAGYFYNSGPRGALRLAEVYRGYYRNADDEQDRAWLKKLSGTWQGIGEATRARLRSKIRRMQVEADGS